MFFLCIAFTTHHDDVIKRKHFPCYCPLWGESTTDWWIPFLKAIDVELWCFLWFTPEPFSKQWRSQWFEKLSCSLWCHCNVNNQETYWCIALFIVVQIIFPRHSMVLEDPHTWPINTYLSYYILSLAQTSCHDWCSLFPFLSTRVAGPFMNVSQWHTSGDHPQI